MEIYLFLLFSVLMVVHCALLPPIGVEVPSSILAINSVLEYQGKKYQVDFRGGIKQHIDVNPDDPINSVRLRTIGFRITAEVESNGQITIEQNDIDVDAKSTLRVIQKFPSKYEEHDVLPFAITIDLSGQDPVVLTTEEPMILNATLTQYPAKGDLYRLVNPVQLVLPEDPDKIVAQLTIFASKRGGL